MENRKDDGNVEGGKIFYVFATGLGRKLTGEQKKEGKRPGIRTRRG